MAVVLAGNYLFSLGVDTEPEEDIIDDDKEEKSSQGERDRTGDTKIDNKNKDKEASYKQVKWKEPDERKEEFVFLVVDSIEKASSCSNHTDAEDDVCNGDVEVDLEKVSYFILLNLHQLPCFSIHSINFSFVLLLISGSVIS